MRVLHRRDGLVARFVGDPGSAYINGDVALRTRTGRDLQGIEVATAAESSFCSIRHRYLACIEPEDGLAEVEQEGHNPPGHTANVVVDGDDGGYGVHPQRVKGLRELRRRQCLICLGADDTGSAHIDRDGASCSWSRRDHQCVDTANYIAGGNSGDVVSDGEDRNRGRSVAEKQRIAIAIADEEIKIAVVVDIGQGRAGGGADIADPEGIGGGCGVGWSSGAYRGGVAEHQRVAVENAVEEI